MPDPIETYPRLRQSLLSQFDDCALSASFSQRYERGWSTHPQGRGSTFHRFAAEAFKAMSITDNTTIDVDTAMGIFNDVMRQHDVDAICHEPGCELPARFIPKAERVDERVLICDEGHRHRSDVVNVPARERADLEWIVRKWSRDNVWDIRNLVDVERRLTMTVTYPDEHGGHVERLLTGQLDALFTDPEDPTHAIVIDHKDTWMLPAPTEVSFEGYFQQRFYALLVFANYRSIQRVTLREVYVRYSEPREATLHRADVDPILADVSGIVERFDRSVRDENYPPTPGRHCGFCPRPQACPIPVHVRADGRITSAEQAERLGGQVVVAEIVLKNTRSALKHYVDIHGPVPIKDSKGQMVWGFEPVVRESKPTAEQVAEAHRTGRDPSKLYRRSSGTRFGRITLRPGHEKSEDDALSAALKASLGES